MGTETEEVVKSTIDDMDQNVLRAVYALNMCTVSVSQIIDYNDVYILEQEYDAILNNLNLEKMPKADALKKILVELLNTITFFRIQEIRKQEIEEQYQRRMKNAIWSAVPNLNIIVSGRPLPIAFSIASQVGIGYMNYRKEKNKIADERHKEELELKITAIEQFHALRRELFTTAWELAEEYNFEDRLRLTEKQIKQYNQILMDQNELRKYERLEAIAEKFEAFPPFWYYFGHTAASIAGNKSLNIYDVERKIFRDKAKKHFSHYEKLNKFNILREDQMTAAFALEYVDLLLLEEDWDTEENKNKIRELIDIANNMSGTFLDIKQLCVIAYLKIGSTKEAAALLKQLVNEEYNTITNAKILSRIYISEYLENRDADAKFNYDVLKMRVGEKKEKYLFPMPQLGDESDDLGNQYLNQLKYCVKEDYKTILYQWMQKYVCETNALIPAPYGYESYEDYYCNSKSAFTKRDDDILRILKDTNKKNEYLQRLENVELGHGLIDILNNSLSELNELDIWKSSYDREVFFNDICNDIKKDFKEKDALIKMIQKNLNSKQFTIEDYRSMQQELSFNSFFVLGKDDLLLEEAFDKKLNDMKNLSDIETVEYQLVEFCHKYNYEPDCECDDGFEEYITSNNYIEYDILGVDEIKRKKIIDIQRNMRKFVDEAKANLIRKESCKTDLLIPGKDGFERYYSEINEKGLLKKSNVLMVLADKTNKEYDLIFTYNSLYLLKNKTVKNDFLYFEVSLKENKLSISKSSLFKKSYYYANHDVDIVKLYDLIQKIDEAQPNLEDMELFRMWHTMNLDTVSEYQESPVESTDIAHNKIPPLDLIEGSEFEMKISRRLYKSNGDVEIYGDVLREGEILQGETLRVYRNGSVVGKAVLKRCEDNSAVSKNDRIIWVSKVESFDLMIGDRLVLIK